MKQALLRVALILGLAIPALATSYTYSGSAYVIPDGNPIGAFSTITVASAGTSLTNITVSLEISGGFNGDLYGYLSYNSSLVTLLNRVGVESGNSFGSPGSGFAVILGSSGTDVHSQSAPGLLSGSFLADGRGIDPLSPPA